LPLIVFSYANSFFPPSANLEKSDIFADKHFENSGTEPSILKVSNSIENSNHAKVKDMTEAAVLDDLNKIRKIDKSNMLALCVEASKHYQEAMKLAEQISFNNFLKPETIIVAGAGGSAIGGELLKDLMWGKIGVPIEVCREYSLPAYANEKTLVFIVSYSGVTEEALAILLDAVKRKCMIVCISSGGQLLKFSEKLKLPHLRVPSGMAPRAALPYLFTPIPLFLERLGLVSNVGVELSEAVKILEKAKLGNSPKTPLSDNFSKNLASRLAGTVPIIYGFGIYRSVAQRVKQQFNENSKVPSKWEFFPELNHNEIVGWASKELAKVFSVVFIRDEGESPETRWRIEVTKEFMSGKVAKVFEVWSRGKSRLARMLFSVYIGDLVSVYLAILRGVDPTPVEAITLLKEKVKQSGVKEKTISELDKLCGK
jgi:glucose/mannose-6-phosphate isomerase